MPMFDNGSDRGNNNSLPIFSEKGFRAGDVVRFTNYEFPEECTRVETVDYLFRCHGGCALCLHFESGGSYNVSSWSVIGEKYTEEEAKEIFFKKFPDCPEAKFLRLESEIVLLKEEIKKLKGEV